MAREASSPGELREQADAALEENASRLRELLRQAASQLNPFPQFYGSLTVQAVEVEPPRGPGPDRGCIVVCPDGELYELTVNFASHPLDIASGMEREEKVKKIDLPPLEYIAYAYNAIDELTRLLAQR
ncbi:MAG: hypothetical protein ACE5KI_08050 [Dehalococcoidia bacterium]